jgi:hypothetical protein
MANLPVASFPETGPAVLTDLVGGSRAPHAVGDDLKLTVQELADAVNILTGAGALALADKFAAYQAGGKSVTTQQIFDAVNVLTGAGALALADKLAGYQAGGRSATIQQVHDSVNVLAAAAALATADKVATTQAGVGKAATVQQVFDATNVLTATGALAVGDKLAAYQAGGKAATVQQVFDATNVLTAAGALAVGDKVAAYQAGGKSATVQQIFDATNVLTVASSPLTAATKLAAFQTTGKSATVQQVLDTIDALAGAAALAGTDTIAVIQAAAAKEATLTQLTTFLQTQLLTLNGSAFNIVGGSTSATTNGTNLIAAYAAGAAATPQGAALSDTNRFTVFLLPGIFDLGAATLAMSTQFVDIVGLGRQFNGTLDETTNSTGGCVVTSSGTAINKTANNAHLMNFALVTSANSLTTPAYTSSGTNGNEIFAYMTFKGVGGANSRGMVRGVTFPGYYYRCVNLGADGFGSQTSGNASGTFVECKSGIDSFGGSATASGLFMYCEASGGSFGGSSGGVASGTFVGCRKNQDYGSSTGVMFGFASSGGTFLNCDVDTGTAFGAGTSGTANGTYIGCRATGVGSFGASGVTSTGTFRYCTAGSTGFSSSGTAGGTYEFCVGTDRCFGGESTGTASGIFRYCVATGIRSFAHRGTASGTFIGCIGGDGSFAGDEQGVGGGTASGTFLDCVAGVHGFGGSSSTPGTMSGNMRGCTISGHWRISLTGKVENMRVEAVAANTSAMSVGTASTGAIYNVTLVGTGTGLSLDVVSGTPTIKVAHCRMNKGISASITNAIGTPYIVDDTDII